jgi:uncharacterized protein Yka (UPF0111/DUF47 family)
MSTTDEYADEVLAATDDYLTELRACVDLLPVALGAYGGDDFESAVARLCERESAADDRLQTIGTLLGDLAPPNFTDVYLRTGEVMRLYSRLDAVANTVERFVRYVGVMGPDLSDPTLAEFGRMADRIVEATGVLADATTAYVETLVTPGDNESVTDAVERVAALEGACDDDKYAAIDRAFDERPAAEALVIRVLALALDAAADAAEDAADHLLFMSGAAH